MWNIYYSFFLRRHSVFNLLNVTVSKYYIKYNIYLHLHVQYEIQSKTHAHDRFRMYAKIAYNSFVKVLPSTIQYGWLLFTSSSLHFVCALCIDTNTDSWSVCVYVWIFSHFSQQCVVTFELLHFLFSFLFVELSYSWVRTSFHTTITR